MSFLCEWGSGSRSGKCWLRESDRAAVQQLTVWDECSNWIPSEALKIWKFKKTSMCPHVTPCIWWYCVVAHLTLMIKQWFLVFYLRPVLQQCWAHEWWPAVTSWYWRFQKWQILKDKVTRRHNLAALRNPQWGSHLASEKGNAGSGRLVPDEEAWDHLVTVNSPSLMMILVSEILCRGTMVHD